MPSLFYAIFRPFGEVPFRSGRISFRRKASKDCRGEHPEAAMNLMRQIAAYVRKTERWLVDILQPGRNVITVIMKWLLHEGDPVAPVLRFDLRQSSWKLGLASC